MTKLEITYSINEILSLGSVCLGNFDQSNLKVFLRGEGLDEEDGTIRFKQTKNGYLDFDYISEEQGIENGTVELNLLNNRDQLWLEVATIPNDTTGQLTLIIY